jgi:hypothetical protein
MVNTYRNGLSEEIYEEKRAAAAKKADEDSLSAGKPVDFSYRQDDPVRNPPPTGFAPPPKSGFLKSELQAKSSGLVGFRELGPRVTQQRPGGGRGEPTVPPRFRNLRSGGRKTKKGKPKRKTHKSKKNRK